MRSQKQASMLIPVIVALCAESYSPLLWAQAAGPYSPEQVYFLLYDAIRQAMGVPLNDPTQPVWLNLSTVGSIADSDDVAHVNDLANFCPPPTPVIATFGTEPKLDAIYLRLLNASVGPVRNYSAEYYKSKAVLEKNGQPTAEVKKYRDAQKAYVTAWTKFYYAKGAGDRNLAALDMRNAEQDWGTGGYRALIDHAREVTAKEEAAVGDTRNATRRFVLDSYKGSGLTESDILGAYTSPSSRFSPEPSKWAASTGWVKVSYAVEDKISHYSSSSSSSSGFGGISLGFVTIGGTAGGKRTTENRVNQVLMLSYEFELMRASIIRPWLDTTLFFEPQDWTWLKNPATTTYPFVAIGKDTVGRPQPSPTVLYDNKTISCALLPTDAVVARNRKITATVSKTDYQNIQASGGGSAGGSLFGIFGGAGKKNWSESNVIDDGHNVTFTVSADGIAVIGFVSQFLPKTPDPNRADKWSDAAWLPATSP